MEKTLLETAKQLVQEKLGKPDLKEFKELDKIIQKKKIDKVSTDSKEAISEFKEEISLVREDLSLVAEKVARVNLQLQSERWERVLQALELQHSVGKAISSLSGALAGREPQVEDDADYLKLIGVIEKEISELEKELKKYEG